MNKFKFRLESLKKIYEQREEKAKKELAVYVKELKLCQQHLSALNGICLNITEDLQKKKTGKVNMQMVVVTEAYLRTLQEKIHLKEKEKIKIEDNVKAKRLELNEIIKQRKILDKLKEKQFKTYLKEANRLEQKILDEIATNIFLTTAGGY